MLKSRLRQHPGEYGHHFGGGQLATYEVQPEEAPRQPDPVRHGHHCGGGQLAAYEVQPEEQHGLHIEDDRSQSVPKPPERVVWTNVQ